ncbi:MAG: hypothetical protein KAI41_12365 [Hyphomicrobiaceae bacterium]|nr:hypothetical protein [Hyphomicrobiaceae bacterium]
MNRRNFLSIVGGSVSAALVPDLGPLDLSPVHAATGVVSGGRHAFDQALLDLLFENMDAPEFHAGTLHISLHTGAGEL